MQIFVSGDAKKGFAPDRIVASATFSCHAKTYQDALTEGVKKVKAYIDAITENTDFTPDDFTTETYYIQTALNQNQLMT